MCMQGKNIRNGEVKDGRLMVDPNHIEMHNEILCRSATEALSLLGESAMQSLLWTLSEKGIRLNPTEFDIEEFAHTLEKSLQGGSDVIMNLIYVKFDSNLRSNMNIDVKCDSKLSALEKIVKLAEVR